MALDEVRRQCGALRYAFQPIRVDEVLYQEAPATKQYPKEMYYRLLAPHLLSNQIKRVLYLGPDILLISPIRPLWVMEYTAILHFCSKEKPWKPKYIRRFGVFTGTMPN